MAMEIFFITSRQFWCLKEHGTNLYIGDPNHMTKMAAMPHIVKPLKYRFRNRWTDLKETCREASVTNVLQNLYK